VDINEGGAYVVESKMNVGALVAIIFAGLIFIAAVKCSLTTLFVFCCCSANALALASAFAFTLAWRMISEAVARAVRV